MDLEKLTTEQKAEYRYFYDAVRKLDWDLRCSIWYRGRIPNEWFELIQGDRRPDRVRVTLRLDEDVVRFFRRQWGKGYQAEVNRVLRSFLKLHLSRIARGEDGFETLLGETKRGARPESGQAERDFAGRGLLGGLGSVADQP